MKPTKRIEAHQIPEIQERAARELGLTAGESRWLAERGLRLGAPVSFPPPHLTLEASRTNHTLYSRAPRPFPWLVFTVGVLVAASIICTLVGVVTVLRWVGRVL